MNAARGDERLEVTECGSGATANSSRGFRPLGDQILQKLKRYESVTQITYLVPDLVWVI